MTCWVRDERTRLAYQGMAHIYAVVMASGDDIALLTHARQMRLLCESIRDRHRRQLTHDLNAQRRQRA